MSTAQKGSSLQGPKRYKAIRTKGLQSQQTGSYSKKVVITTGPKWSMNDVAKEKLLSDDVTPRLKTGKHAPRTGVATKCHSTIVHASNGY